MKFDQFEAVSSASRSYIMPGETYEAELFLGALLGSKYRYFCKWCS